MHIFRWGLAPTCTWSGCRCASEDIPVCKHRRRRSSCKPKNNKNQDTIALTVEKKQELESFVQKDGDNGIIRQTMYKAIHGK